MEGVRLGDRLVNHSSLTYFIAEIGINHNGSIDIAKQLIDLAVLCGADAVKFQKRTLEICIPQEYRSRIRDTPWGEMTYIEYKQKLEFGRDEFDVIDAYCKERGIAWTASAWDMPSLDFLNSYNLPFHKVASAMLTHKTLLEAIKETGKPTLLSTGMSTDEEIDKAVSVFGDDYPLILMHTSSEYPAADESLNLSYLSKLQQKSPSGIVGYSGHELGISASLIAAMSGAKVIERHITLDRAMWGTDQAASIEMDGLRRLIRDLKKIPIWLGDGKKVVTENEENIKSKLRYIDTL